MMFSHSRPFTTALVALSISISAAIAGLPAISHASQPPAPQLVGKMMVAEPAPQAVRIGVRVDTEALGSDMPMTDKIIEAVTATTRAEGFDQPLDAADPQLVIVVEPIGDVENPGFVVGFSLELGDEVVPNSARQLSCPLCTRTELIERIEAELPSLLELAREHQAKRSPGDDGPIDDPLVEPIDQRNIGPLGFAGIGVAVVGLAGVGAGVGLAIKGFEPIAPDFDERKNFRTPGNVMLAVGGVALIAGVAMIAVDVSKRRKAKSKTAAKLRPIGLGIAF